MLRRKASKADTARRILYVEGNVDDTVGGSYYSLLFLTSRLDRSRFEPIVVFATENELIARFLASGIRTIVRRPPTPKTIPGRTGRIAAKALNFLRGGILEPIRLAVLLRRECISLVHLNNSIIKNHSWMVAAWIARIPCVTHERGINLSYLRRARFLARSLDAIICISAAVHNNMLARGLAHLPMVTIHNGLDPAEMRVTRSPREVYAELALDGNARLVGMVGNIRAWKGQEIAVRAMALLRSDFPDVICILIGDTSTEESDYRVKLLKLIGDLELDDRVRITGYRRDVANYVNALEVQIHASIAPEPFGRVLLEAMALGKPLVASGDGAVPEIVVHGATGLLFEPGQAESLASCLRSLLAKPAQAAAMGRAGYERLLAGFSIEQHVLEIEKLYERILGTRS